MKPKLKYRARYIINDSKPMDYSAYVGSAMPGHSSKGVMSHDSNPVGWLEMKIIFGIPGLVFLGLLAMEIVKSLG